MLVWFYCLPVIHVILLVVFASFVFLICKKRWEKEKLWLGTISALTVLWLLLIFYATVGNRSVELQKGVHMIPLYSYYLVIQGAEPEILRSAFMNVVLFYPAGLLAGAVWLQRWKAWKRILLVAAAGCGMSILIEVVQYSRQLGLAEVDDVIHNTLGIAIGAWVSSIHFKDVFKFKRES